MGKKAEERKATTKLKNYILENSSLFNSFVCEMKFTDGDYLPFKEVKTHQIQSLLNAKVFNGISHKISDSPIYSGMKTRFTNQKPFDLFFVKNVEAYVGICFHKKNEKWEVILIDVEVFLREQNTSKRKSLTKERATVIADRILQV